MVEGDLERASERAEAGESKIVDLEEELRYIFVCCREACRDTQTSIG
jgi:hypothetical protein